MDDQELKAKVKIEPDPDGANKSKQDIKSLGDEAEGAGEKAKKASFDFKEFATNAGLGATAVLGAVTGIAALAVKTAGEFETQEMAFKTLLGNTAAAKKEMADIQKTAIETPFNLPELLKANQLLLAAGVKADDAQEDVVNLGKAVAATGGSSDTLLRMASNLQQIKAVGKATAMDIRQFGFAGIPIYQLLADVTHKSVDEVKDMEIGYEDLAAALSNAGNGAGRYAHAFSDAQDTFQVKFSNFQDAISIGLAKIAKDSGLLDAVKNGLTVITDFINTTAIPAFMNFLSWVSQNQTVLFAIAGIIGALLVAALIAFMTVFGPVILATLAFAAAGALVGAVLSLLWPVIQTVTDFLSQHHEWLVAIGTFILVMLIPTIYGLITSLLGLAATLIVNAIGAIIATIIALGPLILIALVVAAVVGLVAAAWASNWGNIRQVTENIINWIIGKINSLIGVLNKLIGMYNAVMDKAGLANLKLGEVGKIGAVDINTNVSSGGGGSSILPEFSGGSLYGPASPSTGPSAQIMSTPASSTVINQTNYNYNQADVNSMLGDMGWALKK